MRFFLVLFALAALAFASDTISGQPGGTANYTLPGTDDIYDSYAYNAGEQMDNIGASFGDYAVVDDYNGSTIDMTSYTMWGVTTVSAPSALEIMVVPDDSGVPSAAGPSSQDSYPATSSDTGMTYGSYAIWISVVDASATPVALAAPVWLGTHRAGADNWYPIGGTTVTGTQGYRTVEAGWAWAPFSESLVAGDLFKVLEGNLVALERNTWAGIKNMF